MDGIPASDLWDLVKNVLILLDEEALEVARANEGTCVKTESRYR